MAGDLETTATKDPLAMAGVPETSRDPVDLTRETRAMVVTAAKVAQAIIREVDSKSVMRRYLGKRGEIDDRMK